MKQENTTENVFRNNSCTPTPEEEMDYLLEQMYLSYMKWENDKYKIFIRTFIGGLVIGAAIGLLIAKYITY